MLWVGGGDDSGCTWMRAWSSYWIFAGIHLQSCWAQISIGLFVYEDQRALFGVLIGDVMGY